MLQITHSFSISLPSWLKYKCYLTKGYGIKPKYALVRTAYVNIYRIVPPFSLVDLFVDQHLGLARKVFSFAYANNEFI